MPVDPLGAQSRDHQERPSGRIADLVKSDPDPVDRGSSGAEARPRIRPPAILPRPGSPGSRVVIFRGNRRTHSPHDTADRNNANLRIALLYAWGPCE